MGLYSVLLVLTVVSFRPGLYGYQLKQFSWTVVSILVAVRSDS